MNPLDTGTTLSRLAASGAFKDYIRASQAFRASALVPKTNVLAEFAQITAAKHAVKFAIAPSVARMPAPLWEHQLQQVMRSVRPQIFAGLKTADLPFHTLAATHRRLFDPALSSALRDVAKHIATVEAVTASAVDVVTEAVVDSATSVPLPALPGTDRGIELMGYLSKVSPLEFLAMVFGLDAGLGALDNTMDQRQRLAWALAIVWLLILTDNAKVLRHKD